MASSFDRAAAKALLAAAVTDPDEEEPGDWLDSLVHFNLLEHDPDNHRFDWHDLLHEFAATKLDNDRAETARTAHARHYADVAQLSKELYKHGHDSMMQGLALFDRERPQIEAAFAYLQTHSDLANTLLDLVDGMAYIGNLRFHPRQRIQWLEVQAQAARHTGDIQAEGAALGNIGLAYADLGELRKAIEFYKQRLVIAREFDDHLAEGKNLGNIGIAFRRLGEPRKAIDYYEQQLTIAREIGDRRGEGNALGNLGIAYVNLGELRKAIEYCEQQLTIAREIGDRLGEGNALGNSGNAYINLGEPRKAIEYYEQQLTIAREIGDRRGEGNALFNAALAYEALGEREEAIPRAEQALAIYEAMEDPIAAQVRATLAEWKSQP